MRTVLLATVVTLGLATAAWAQMCGGTTGSTGASAMGCMGAAPTADPLADKPAAPAMGGMMCACCRMAMMGGMKHEAPPAAVPAPKSDGPPAGAPKHDMAPMK